MLNALVITLYTALVISVAYWFLRFVDRVQRRRWQRDYEQLKQDFPARVFGTPEYNARFDHPDVAAIEAHLQQPLPESLRSLYRDSSTMRSQHLLISEPAGDSSSGPYRIGYFFPADGDAIADLWPHEELEPHQIPIATDGATGLFYVELTSEGDSLPVYFNSDTRDEPLLVARSLTEFLNWNRTVA